MVRVEPAFLPLLTCVLAWRYLWAHANRPIQANRLAAHAWFAWADQGEYYRAAKAWASWNLDWSQHHYPAGYALLAAPFVSLFPQEPFIVVDLLCWAASLWVFAAIAERLAPDERSATAVGAGVFFLVTVANTSVFYTWETPWTSTPATLCVYLALLAALRFSGAPRFRSAFAASLAAGLVILFRPTDFAVLGAALGLFLPIALWQHRLRPGLLRLAAGAALGFSVGPVLLLITHVATHGWTLGGYFEQSRRMGFEWRLLPLRWVTLMLNPRPLYPEGDGLAQRYWWILPGIAGIIASALADRGCRLRHVFVGGTAIAFTCVYLCYRDLHVPGLFGFENQHYFKWVVPVFALYAAGLARLLLVEKRFAAIAAAAAVVVLLSCWRAELVITDDQPWASVLPEGRRLMLPHGPAPLNVAYLASSSEDFLGLYLGHHTIDQGGTLLQANAAFKIFPMPFGFMLMPLRVLPQQPATLHLEAAVRMDRTKKVFSARQKIVFGLPCAVFHKRNPCQYSNGPAWNALVPRP